MLGSRLTGAIVVLVIAGCSDSAGPEPTDGLVTTIALDRAYITTTDRVNVTITTWNPTSRTISFESACSGPIFRVFRGLERVNSGSCAIPEMELFEIAPGDSMVTNTSWGILYYDVNAGARIPLPAGRYRLVGGIDTAGDLNARSAPAEIEVRVP